MTKQIAEWIDMAIADQEGGNSFLSATKQKYWDTFLLTNQSQRTTLNIHI